MNWFDTSGLTNLAKSALKEAQKTIDKALDIQDDSSEEQDQSDDATASSSNSIAQTDQTKDGTDFFASWGLTVSAESAKDESSSQQVVTESPCKGNSQSLWGSFAGSFFEQPKTDETAVVRPPKAKSMTGIADTKFGSQDDLLCKSQVMSESVGDGKHDKLYEQRRGSARSGMSLEWSGHSSESVEVVSSSAHWTPPSNDSPNSASSTPRPPSDSVEVLPDSLVSPSSIECIGFDSSSSEKYSASLSNSSPQDEDPKSTPLGERTERVATADSISLVNDDDEDTMSYNSISECTAPTILDTDEKSSVRVVRTEPRKTIDKDFMHLEQPILPQRLQISGNSSNDGSWSDRTLNADNESITMDPHIEEVQKIIELEENLIDKLSDSSSFYNVNVTPEAMHSDSCAFVNIESRTDCTDSQKDCSLKERTSPISSDSKSDLVKIGSDRTSGHTSGDEIETATSSDIEIIPSPNGEGYCRSSPGKIKDMRTHARGGSGASDVSGSELERELRGLIEARDARLAALARHNAILSAANSDLKAQIEVRASHDQHDINTLTEDYALRMSALEKKFQQAIREKDELRKHLENLKLESSRKTSSEMENVIQERDDMITQLQEEGEKLSKQQLQQSNIIKKLRAKEKDNEQVIKSLRDKIAEQASELDRLKRSVAAKEELEVSQIEAVYRLTTANKKYEAELMETKSLLDDTLQRLDSNRVSLDSARKELADLQRANAELTSRRDESAAALSRGSALEQDNERLRASVDSLRRELREAEQRHLSREESLRQELNHALESGMDVLGTSSLAESLARELSSAQATAAARERAHQASRQALKEQCDASEASLAKAIERERLAREEITELRRQLTEKLHCEQCDKLTEHIEGLKRVNAEMESAIQESNTQRNELADKLKQTQESLQAERLALENEKKKNATLMQQERVSARGDSSPPHSVLSDTMSNSLWGPGVSYQEESPLPISHASALCLEDALTTLTRREGELRLMRTSVEGLKHERDVLRRHLAQTTAERDQLQSLQEQYDALLQMYGEKEEQVQELQLDLRDLTQLYKAQLQELLTLQQR